VLTKERVVNDTLAGTDVVLVAAAKQLETSAVGRWGTPVEYASGSAVRAYRRDGRAFQLNAATGQLRDGSGVEWKVTEAALEGPNGVRLDRLPGHLAYWFGWYAFFPETLLYK
jgi:hypothetical protein